ncbi:APC family permease [Halocalculus aciditolerans]|uniref:Amino acid permease n=1 Tax=Halocalculus aciditolerans TaxID=1383812 RepID=A0A830F5C0_9EURY|nr:APC family permease [Halocalculus aciditolerans]GGL64910.1 amino acid permease [Halocalculus aciditolerans]
MQDSDGLPRTVGLRDLLVLSVGGMIGSAVFFFPAFTGQWVGPTAILAWLAAGVGMVAVALCYTELATAFPESGGPAVFPAETLGPNPVVRRFFAYLEGTSYALGWVFGVAVSAWYVANYLGAIPPLAGVRSHTVAFGLLAVVASLAVTLSGIDVTKRANLVLTAFVLAVLAVVAAVGLANGDPANAQPFVTGTSTQFLAAVGVAITGYGAWTVVPAAAGEVKNPEWTIPRAIVGSLLLTTALYTLVVVALHVTVPPSAFESGNLVMVAPLSAVVVDAGLPALANYALPVAALVAIFTTMLVGMTSSARVLAALADRDTFPRAFAATSDRTNAPYVALTVVAVAAGAVVVGKAVVGGLVLAALVGTVLPYTINVASFVGLRRYRTDVTPSFRAPGGLLTAALAFCFLVLLAVGLSVDHPVAAALTVAALLGGFALQYAFGANAPTAEHGNAD